MITAEFLDFAVLCKHNFYMLETTNKQLAMEIINVARDEILFSMPYLTRALLYMPVVFYEDEIEEGVTIGFGSDGENLYVIAEMVIKRYMEDPHSIAHMLLHTLFHCLYQHPFHYETMHFDHWDLASDMAVEYVIANLNMNFTSLDDDHARSVVLEAMKAKSHNMNAESIYSYLNHHSDEAKEFLKKRELFCFDVHQHWMSKDVEGKIYLGDDQSYAAKTKVNDQWKKMERAVQTEILSFEKTQGYEPGSLSKLFEGDCYSEYDYSEFLRKFAVMSEEIRVNHEEFDYVYYNYGIEMYGNMPLIEPLEYREDNKIRDFVVAIDTSGSVQGSLVQNFLRKTWAMLQSEENFFYDVNIHILQCDSKIQSDVTIHNQQEFDAYMKHVQLKGFGGTDFRPVFQHVNTMIANGRIKDLRGLIYYTDGKGIFPEVAPDYKTAFIFVDNGFMQPNVPAWAIRLILPVEEFEE